MLREVADLVKIENATGRLVAVGEQIGNEKDFHQFGDSVAELQPVWRSDGEVNFAGQLILQRLDVGFHHDFHQISELRLRLPAENTFGFRGVAH
ncbi:MAG: hypothetical protein PCFJNLEI_01875 [Verrucomicrobiae bacterium]|nr:hypothetical protein [Verrucomicrobiae bacterium]